MPHRSIRERTAALDRLLLSPERYVSARLEVRSSTGEFLFTVGGCWDTIAKRYVDRPCSTRAVTLQKSQDEIGRALGQYITQRLAGDDSRPALIEAIGNRGGGKTFVLGGVFMVALALALPRCWQIGVSITSKQNREVKEAIAKIAPPEWITQDVTDFRDQRTEFLTGSTVLWLTAKNPKALRQALLPFEHVLINEGQDQREVVFTNSISAIRSGGIVTVATNPPQEQSGAGDWVAVLYDHIQNGSRDAQAFVLRGQDNAAISQPTMGKIGRLLMAVNRDAYEADALGEIKLAGNVGYQGFSRGWRKEDASGLWLSGHVGEPPARVIGLDGTLRAGWEDVTRQKTAEALGGDVGTDYVGGSDFQADPGCCSAIGKLYRTPARELVLYIVDFVGTTGTEQDLTVALNSRGYYPGSVDYDGRPAASLLLVGDATGARQDAEHRKRNPYSFMQLQADGWRVLPPDRIGKKRTPWNPLIPDSRKQMKACFLSGSILISPKCLEPTAQGFPSLVESFMRAKVNSFGKFEKGKNAPWTHGPDGVRYLAWRFLPRSVAPKPQGLDDKTFDSLMKLRVFQNE